MYALYGWQSFLKKKTLSFCRKLKADGEELTLKEILFQHFAQKYRTDLT